MVKQSERPCVGVDLGGTNIQAGVLGAGRRVLSRAKIKTRAEEDAAGVIERLAEAIEDAVRGAGLKLSAVGGVGIGAPGAVDIDKGVVIMAPNLRWNSLPLAARLKRRLGMPVVLDNDVNVAAWGEHQAGAGRGHDDMLAVWVGTGIGGGLVLSGQLYYGHYFTAGEIGHTILHADAPLGRRTFENIASRTAIVNLLTQLIAANQPSKLTQIAGNDFGAIRSKALARALRLHDPLTHAVVERAAHYVGVAIANTVTMLSLPCVVIGGGLTDSLGEPWVKWIRKSFEETVFPQELRACKLLASQLGDDAGIVGAALLAHKRLWKT